jgi:hypothetical protein
MTTPPLTNPLLDPAHLAALAQQAQQTQPAMIRPPSAESPPPPISLPGMGGSTPQIPIPAAPNVTRIPTQLENEKTEQARKVNTGSGISQIAGKIENSSLGQAHPLVGKLLGGAAQGLATLGDVGLRAVAPSVDLALPGTSLHHLADIHGGNKQIAADEAANESETQQQEHAATTAKTQQDTALAPAKEADTHALTESEIADHNAQAAALLHPQAKTDFEAWQAQNPGKPIEDWIKANQKPVAENPQKTAFDALVAGGMTPEQAYEKVREKPPGASQTGTWQVEESTSGAPMLFNSKTGQTQAGPQGMQKAGTKAKADAALKPVQDALNYAQDYASRKLHTGPGDEAMMEKFFELAKPSTGFRMSQPQIDMLRNAQSWMGSLEAHLRHATTGTWFSDTQRQQIAATMGDLGKAKGISAEGAQGGGQPQQFQATSSDGKWGWDGSKWVAISGGK